MKGGKTKVLWLAAAAYVSFFGIGTCVIQALFCVCLSASSLHKMAATLISDFHRQVASRRGMWLLKYVWWEGCKFCAALYWQRPVQVCHECCTVWICKMAPEIGSNFCHQGAAEAGFKWHAFFLPPPSICHRSASFHAWSFKMLTQGSSTQVLE